MNRSKGWTGSSPNPWRNLKARPDRAFNGLCLGFENLFPGCAIGRAAIPPPPRPVASKLFWSIASDHQPVSAAGTGQRCR
jgi:hypothetical protein